jgi:hypothetical protein
VNLGEDIMTFWDGLTGLTPVELFMESNIILKLIMILVMFNGFVALILAILRHATKGPRSGILTGLGAGALIFATLGAAYNGYFVYVTAKQLKISNLAIIAPSVAESLLCFGLGVIVMLIAVIGNWGAPKGKR